MYARVRSAALLAFLMLSASRAHAADYFVSAQGSDANDGTSEGKAWKTLAQVQAQQAKLQPGDTVRFRRGDTFEGSLVLSRSGTAGSPIVYGAYGSGARPRLSGFSRVTGLKKTGNVYAAVLPASVSLVNTVRIGGVAGRLGRVPALDAAGGWLGIASVGTPNAAKELTITSQDPLPAGGPYVGGEVAVRRERSVLERWRIVTQAGNTLTIVPTDDAGTYLPEKTNGFFIQNHVATLQNEGDWAFDEGTHTLSVYHVGPLTEVEVSTVEDVLTLNPPAQAVAHITLEELAFEGATRRAIVGTNASNITIRQSEFRYDGRQAVYMTGSLHLRFEDNLVEDCPSSGVYFRYLDAAKVGDLRITGNTFRRIGTVSGMGASDSASYQAITETMHNATIEGNVVQDVGYNGITFMGGDGLRIRHNLIERVCGTKDDGAAIYTWNGSSTKIPTWSDRIISENVVRDGVGAPSIGSTSRFASGIYLDLDSNNVQIDKNVVSGHPRNAITMNNPVDVRVTGNVIYDSTTAIRLTRYVKEKASDLLAQDITGLQIEQNVVFPKQIDQAIFIYQDLGTDVPTPSTVNARLGAIGTIDKNIYGGQNPLPIQLAYRSTGVSPLVEQALSLATFATLGFDKSSTLRPPLPLYTLDAPLGKNLFAGGTFDANIANLGGNKTSIDWDGTGKLTGAGSIRITPPDESPKDGKLIIGSIGAIKANAHYLLRFTTLGSKADSVVSAYLRQASNPFTTVSSTRNVAFGNSVQKHEVLLTATQANANAAFTLRVAHQFGTVYLDDIEVYEVAATPLDPDDLLRLEANAADTPTSVPLDATYEDTQGKARCGSLPLAPWTGAILTRTNAPCTPTGGAGGSVGSAGQGGTSAGGTNAGGSNTGGANSGGSSAGGASAGSSGTASSGQAGAAGGSQTGGGGTSAAGGTGQPGSGGTSTAGGNAGVGQAGTAGRASGGASGIGGTASNGADAGGASDEDSGCACRAVPAQRGTAGSVAALLAMGAVITRRRNRSRRA